MLSCPRPDPLGGIRKMKRKISLDETTLRESKRQLLASPKDVFKSHPLVIIVRQYGLLESVVSNLRANDLLALALTSKALYASIFATSTSLENLLGRVKCSGRGVGLRNERHKKSSFFYSYNCVEHVKCGSNTEHEHIETKPCVTCKLATCNECRIHCVYQSIFEASSDSEDTAELPNFSGFVLLQPLEQPILSPHHLVSDIPSTVPRWQDPTEGQGGPYHDQGYLDVPLETGTSAPPECIEDVLDLDLGCHSLISMSGDSRYAAPSPVLLSLCNVTEARKIEICTPCMDRGVAHKPRERDSHIAAQVPADKISDQTVLKPYTACDCTLRKRMLDRWLCLRCYSAEELDIEAHVRVRSNDTQGICGCGEPARHMLCLWCSGRVTEESISQAT